MKKITVMGADNQLHEITLTINDIMAMQTKESKRTFAFGAASTLTSIASMLMPKGKAKYITLAISSILTIGTLISSNDMSKRAANQENIDRINDVLREVCAREGFIYCC